MTINKYYHTFGFLVKKEDYLRYFGFTKENLPEEYRETDGDYVQTDDDLDTALYEWIHDTHGNSLELERVIEVDGVNFIVRSFTHDTKYEDYVVVGIDLGTLDRWDGARENGTNCSPKNRIRTLARNEDWIKMIQACDRHCTSYVDIDYGVKDPECESFYICPVVRISTDDCDCCS